MRGYVFTNDPESDENGDLTLKGKIREEMVGKLATEWNMINQKIEMRGWLSRDERMDEEDYHADQAADCADVAEERALELNPNLSKDEIDEVREKASGEYYQELKKKDNEIYLRKQVIEELLSELGARMARPYEHWNEEERYMEYMETRYDNERDWDY
jgi:hypothetical protein